MYKCSLPLSVTGVGEDFDMSQYSGLLESGELADTPFDFKEIRWMIPNVLDFPDKVDYKVQSSTFSFAGALWKLTLYPFGRTGYGTVGYIDLLMERLKSQFLQQKVFYKFYFETKDGKKLKSFEGSFNFYSVSSDCRGLKYFMKNSNLRDRKNDLAPNDTLIIVCLMRIKKGDLLEKASQTESMTSLSGGDCESSPIPSLLPNKALRDFKDLFHKQEDCDVTINVQGKEFHAHKAILIARSPVFASTFRNDMTEKSTGIINIEDCDPSSFADFLCFLYCESADNMTTENVYGLFTAADKYDVEDLRLVCLEFMKKNLSIDTFCETVTLAFQHLENELIDLAADFYAKHFQKIIVTVKWQRFVIDYPVQSNEIMIKALVPKNE